LEDARHWIDLLQYPSTGAAEGRETPETEGMPRTAQLEPLLFIALWFFARLITGKNLVDSSWDKLCFFKCEKF
jgi:hypothetical protein